MPAHLAALVQQGGHEVLALPPMGDALPSRAETPWLPALQQRDWLQAAQLLALATRCDWLVVDHYGLGEPWEQSAREACGRLMALDDLGRFHACDLLLDQNLYPQGAALYADRLPPASKRLVGPEFALLRPEFRQAHEAARVRDGEVGHLLVFMGGMDAGNVTSHVLKALRTLGFAQRVSVVIGAGHPAVADVGMLCAELPQAQLHVQSAQMAQLCAEADLAVGAGGSATWERCATGLPALALALADNQRPILHNAARAGLLYTPDFSPNMARSVMRNASADPGADAGIGPGGALETHLSALLENSALRHHISRNCLQTVDGLGPARVAQALTA